MRTLSKAAWSAGVAWILARAARIHSKSTVRHISAVSTERIEVLVRWKQTISARIYLLVSVGSSRTVGTRLIEV